MNPQDKIIGLSPEAVAGMVQDWFDSALTEDEEHILVQWFCVTPVNDIPSSLLEYRSMFIALGSVPFVAEQEANNTIDKAIFSADEKAAEIVKPLRSQVPWFKILLSAGAAAAVAVLVAVGVRINYEEPVSNTMAQSKHVIAEVGHKDNFVKGPEVDMKDTVYTSSKTINKVGKPLAVVTPARTVKVAPAPELEDYTNEGYRKVNESQAVWVIQRSLNKASRHVESSGRKEAKGLNQVSRILNRVNYNLNGAVKRSELELTSALSTAGFVL